MDVTLLQATTGHYAFFRLPQVGIQGIFQSSPVSLQCLALLFQFSRFKDCFLIPLWTYSSGCTSLDFSCSTSRFSDESLCQILANWVSLTGSHPGLHVSSHAILTYWTTGWLQGNMVQLIRWFVLSIHRQFLAILAATLFWPNQ